MEHQNQNIKKNEKYALNIDDIGTQGEGIGKIDGFTVFVENALPGERVEVLIVKLKKSCGYGKLLNVIEKSPMRTEPICSAAVQCGGCTLQHLKYEGQLAFKTNKVLQNLRRIGGFKDIDVSPTIGMQNPTHYRNKAQYPVNAEGGGINMGFYAARSHRIINCENCLIDREQNSEVLAALRNFMVKNNVAAYDEKTGSGIVRHVLIRYGYHTKQLMVCVIVNCAKFRYKDELVNAFSSLDGIFSIAVNYNTAATNVILGKKTEILWGKPYIEDCIGSLKFRISPHTFFQVNPTQTEVLYKKALEFAGLTGTETVIDAYCGAGTISLFLAQRAKRVYGVEIVPQAIENAKQNAIINNIKNAEFYVGKSEEVVPQLHKKGITPDVIVVDPPRKGCDKKLLDMILNMQPKKTVYVSCDSATLARDLKYLCENGKYKIEKVQPVDLFPFTCHVESVVLMSKVKE